MSIIDSGKYRLNKDWASTSIQSLVDIDEHEDDEAESILNTTEPVIPPPQKPSRRSSLALAFFPNKSEKSQKRRSSIAVTFFRRDKNKNSSKDSSYESTVRREKSDGINNQDTNFSSEENFRDFQNDVMNANNNRRRRSSLQTKLDRRRRKNLEFLSADNSPIDELQPDMTNDENGARMRTTSNGDNENNAHSPYYTRQKRNSWWNIFVPDNIKQRSRRASQDVTHMSRSFDNLAVPVRRSKSRSVDHGLAAPFDLDSLRSKVEGRFESVDRLTNERKKSSLPSIPTITYTVGNRDTLTSVAARFDTTPSELTHLNRLNSSFIYPGQQLLVPDKSAKDNVSDSSGTANEEKGSNASGKSSPIDSKLSIANDEEKDILEGLRPGSPKPGHIERVDAQIDKKGDDPVITQRFLKINVRHITDGQGVVGGVLLVTPNAVMFDPNVSDPLVIEHGPESYGVIAPMELVVNAAIFHDIAHMRVSGGPVNIEGSNSNTESDANDKPEIYYPKSVLEKQKAEAEQAQEADENTNKHTTTIGEFGSVETCDDQESLCSGFGRDGDAFPKAFDRERVQDQERCASEAKESQSGKTDKDEPEDDEDEDKLKLKITDPRTTLEERRKSLLDHHWAIPSKDRSSEDEGDNESNTTIDSGARGQDPHSATSSLSGVPASNAGAAVAAVAAHVTPAAIDIEHLEELSKQSCYDSGIDIREPIINVQPIPKKTVYSDADIVLSSDWVPPKTISPTHVSESPSRTTLSGSSLDANMHTRKKTSSVSFSVDDNNATESTVTTTQATDNKNTEKKNKMLKRLSYPLTWVEGLTGEGSNPPSAGVGNKSQDNDSAPNTADSNQSVFSKVFSRRSSIGTFMRPHSSEGTASTTKLKESKQMSQPKLDYRSMVSVDDKPGLFISVDKLIPRPARACPDPPLYLRLRMGKPIGKTVPLPTSVMSYGKNKLRPEYWFSVPKNRIDELYRFMNTWVPHLYGELNEEHIKERGFELIQDDTEWTKGGTTNTGGRTSSQENEEISDLTRESWEVLSMSTEEYPKTSLYQGTGSFDLDFPIPDLIGTTEILTEEHREKLCLHLPARAEGYSWSLVFSTSQHGFSLNSLYRKMQRLESPVLIVIEDTEHNVFGALTSCALHVSDHFYGTGESLLYKFNPNFKVFHWTGENLYFIKGNLDCLSIGAGDGRFGLWLDGDLNQGRSQSCSTYGNEPLAPREDFVVKTLECWAFV